MEKCFCHLNGYKVKDADARRMLSGNSSMGDIKVSSIKCKNLFDITKSVVKYQAIGFDISKLEIGKTYTLSSNKPIYGFKISDIEYNYASVQIYEPSGTYQTTFVMSRHESISDEQYLYIRLTVEDGVFVQNMPELDGFEIQIEEGTTATEYVPYFELASKDYIDGTLPMGDIKVSSIKCKNLIKSLSKTGKVIYFNGATSYTDFIFEPGTYTLSYNDENERSLFIQNEDIEAKNLGKNKVITFSSEKPFNIWLYGDGITLEEISEIQLEVGSVATEYAPYFELNKDCGYHVIEMDLGAPVESIPFGELTFSLNSECITKLTKFINDVNKSDVKKPVLKLVNTNQVASEEYSMPTEITYINSSTPVKNIQPNYMFFGVTMHLADMLWRSKLEITGEWNEDTYTCSSASITLYEEVKASGGSGSGDSTPVYLIEHTGGLANATNLAITMGTDLGNKIKDIITNCYNNGCKNFIIKFAFNKTEVTNFYGRTLELCMNITSDNKLLLLNKYSICPYDTYYTRYFTNCSGSFKDGVLISTNNKIFDIQFKENTQIVTS